MNASEDDTRNASTVMDQSTGEQGESGPDDDIAVDDDGIDYDELLAELEDDVKNDRFTPICTNPDETSAALQRYLDAILDEVLNEAATSPGDEAAS